MLSMRAGQPCLAHSVGGLADTIINNKNGFTFNGDNPLQQADHMLSCLVSVIDQQKNQTKAWREVSSNAHKTRFLWQEVANDYIKYLYSHAG